jgi:hypothetical protein
MLVCYLMFFIVEYFLGLKDGILVQSTITYL